MGTFLRSIITPVGLVAFAAVGVTGLMLFFGVRSHPLRDLHEWLGIVFVIVAVLHIARNGRGFTFMMAQTRSLIVVGILGVLAALLVGSALTPGFGSRGFGRHGPPGFGRHAVIERKLAAVPIATSAPALGLTADQAVARLRAGGVSVDGPSEKLVDIGRKTGTPVPRLFRLILEDNDEPSDDGPSDDGPPVPGGPTED